MDTTNRPLALVTGASRGIGAAIARCLGPTHHLLLCGRDREALAAIAEALPSAKPWPTDLADLDQLRQAVPAVDRMDVLVHSAGVLTTGEITGITPEAWRQTFEVNLFAVAELTRLLLPALRLVNGHVVLINSTAGLHANPRRAAYAASKFALRAFADSLRAEEGRVRVTSIYPGRVDTDMQRALCDIENIPYRASEYLAPQTVAEAVLDALNTPEDTASNDIVVRPGT